MPNKPGQITVSADGDTYDDTDDSGLIHCPFPGWYVIEIDGTFGGSSTFTPTIAFGGSRNFKTIPDPVDGTAFVFSANTDTVVVAGNSVVQVTAASFSGSSNIVVRRTKVAD